MTFLLGQFCLCSLLTVENKKNTQFLFYNILASLSRSLLIDRVNEKKQEDMTFLFLIE